MNDPFVYSNEKRSLSFKLSPKVHSALRFHCLDTGETMQSVIESLIESFVDSRGLLGKSRAVLKKKVLH